jgi:hypothetical protein
VSDEPDVEDEVEEGELEHAAASSNAANRAMTAEAFLMGTL